MADEINKTDPKNPQETIDLVRALFKLVQVGEEVMEDGKVTLGDFPSLLGAVIPVTKGIMGAEKIDNEIAVMDSDGEAALKAAIAEFEFDNEDVEALAEMSLNWVVETAKLVKDYIAILRAKKAAEAIA